jgi:hypothetical protein
LIPRSYATGTEKEYQHNKQQALGHFHLNTSFACLAGMGHRSYGMGV